MNLVNDKKKCSGCGACVHICPKKAITFIEDEYGVRYPNINKEKCVNCNLCKKSCEYFSYDKKRDDLKCYAGYTTDDKIYKNSSSGGIFSQFAKNFVVNGGYVCGAIFDYSSENIIVKHYITNKLDELHLFSGSKYVQSNAFLVFEDIKKLLDNHKKVLFSGTPCQIVGLRSYLKKRYDNLYTIDIICHGAPDSKIFSDYTNYLKNKKNISIDKIVFRDKSNGLGLTGYIEGTKKGKKVKIPFKNNEDSYYYLFQNGYLYRKNCYSCPFSSNRRPGDITIGDYWGIEKEHPSFHKGESTSCIIINSVKGNELLENCGNCIELIESSFEKIARNNDQLCHPTIEPILNERLMNVYSKYGYEGVIKYYPRIYGRKKFLIRKMKTLVKNAIKK